PIEVKLFGPDYSKLRHLAEEVSEIPEKKGKYRGIKEVNSNVFAGNPDLLIRVNGIRAARFGLTAGEVERQLQAMYFGQVATQVRESAQRITDVRVRYPDAIRFGLGGFDLDLLRNQWILPPSGPPPAGGGGAGWVGLTGPTRAIPVSAVAEVTPVRTP